MKNRYPKMKGSRVITIYEEITKSKIIILVGNYKDIKKSIPKEVSEYFSKKGYFARCINQYYDGSNYPFHVIIHSRSAAISVIAHEVIHASSFVFSEMGHKASWDNDELLAHFVQYVLENVEAVLND